MNKNESLCCFFAAINNNERLHNQVSAFARTCIKRSENRGFRELRVERFVDEWGGVLRNAVRNAFPEIETRYLCDGFFNEALLAWIKDYEEVNAGGLKREKMQSEIANACERAEVFTLLETDKRAIDAEQAERFVA